MELFRQFAAVCFVVALAALAAYSLRKNRRGTPFRPPWGRLGGPRRMQLIERVSLTPHHHMCLVRVDQQEWLITVHASGMTVLNQRPAPAPEHAPGPEGALK